MSGALSRITAGAAARMLGRGEPLPEFLEQVQYNGRRLAKLQLPPSRITSALSLYDRLLAPLLKRQEPELAANLRWARQQLQFCVVLTLNNAYYQVREQETHAFYEIFRAELEAGSLDELLLRFLHVLREFCRADAAHLTLVSRGESNWTKVASVSEGGAAEIRTSAGADESWWRSGPLRGPLYLSGLKRSRHLMDPGWRQRYASCWSVPLSPAGHIAGVMQFAFARNYEWLPREQDLLTATAGRCLRAAEKAWLVEHLEARQEQVRHLAERMMVVEEQERRRVSRELHDQAGQDLLCVRLKLEMMEQSLAASEDRQRAAEVRNLTERTIVEIRRLIAALSPAVLEQLGLAAALRMLVNRMRQVYPCRVRLRIGRLGRVSKNVEMIVYRLVQESTNNIVKHSRATAVNISLRSADGFLRLTVEDNGVGFAVEEALNRRETFGLAGIRERVALLGGRLEIQSRPGTRVKVDLPVRAEPRLPSAAWSGRNRKDSH